jgi:ring-1,2-phenylacetyl-CoA epoxidase subunit PaaC
LRHSREWTLRLADGTAESRSRIERAIAELWPLSAGLFEEDEVEETLARERIAIPSESLRAGWRAEVGAILGQTALELPQAEPAQVRGGRRGLHSEHLGHLLSEMQILARSHPGAEW